MRNRLTRNGLAHNGLMAAVAVSTVVIGRAAGCSGGGSSAGGQDGGASPDGTTTVPSFDPYRNPSPTPITNPPTPSQGTTLPTLPNDARTPAGGAGAEVQQGLPFGSRTLTGDVTRAGSCALLVVQAGRWALVDTPTPGSRTPGIGSIRHTGGSL